MALGKRTAFELGLVVVRYTRSMSGKRVAIFSNKEVDDVRAITKKHLNEEPVSCFEKTGLEALPQDVLIKILCGVDHDDLKQLFHVSKAIREATIVAKKMHFEVSTPKKRTFALRKFLDFAPSDDMEEIEAPNAPKQSRVPKSRLSMQKLASISVALFDSPDVDVWPKRKSETEK